jgi:hypothetical protein
MNYGKVLGRAWEILWSYRVLWVFGVIVALCSAGAGGQPNMSWGGDDGPGVSPGEIAMPEIPPEAVATIIAFVLAFLCVVIILTVLGLIGLYVSQTALIRMVDDYEETGEKRGVRQGFRLGWSRTTFRIFMIDLLTSWLPKILVLLVVAVLAVGLGAVILLAAMEVIPLVLAVLGGVAIFGLIFLVILVSAPATLVLWVLRQFCWRVCALEELGVIESIGQGYRFVRRHLTDVGLMSLIMVGLQIGWTIVMIPVVLVLLVVAAVVGGLPALLVGGLAGLAFEGAVPWILAAVIFLPIFILVMAAPLLFLGGLAEVFKSNVWTLTYRELRALEGLEPEPGELPEPDTADVE